MVDYVGGLTDDGCVKFVDIQDSFDRGFDKKIWSMKRIEDGRYSYVNNAGKDAIRIELRKGDRQATNSLGIITERSEISEHHDILLPLVVDVWYAFSFFFPDDFPTLNNRTVFAQWKQYTKQAVSPFVSFQYVDGTIKCKIVDSSSDKRIKFAKKGEWRGSWHRIVLNYKLNTDQTGFVHAWLDGEEFVNYQGNMGYPAKENLTYFKMGLYRDQVEPTQTIYLADYRRTFEPTIPAPLI